MEEREPVRAVIIYLSRSKTKDISDLKRSLSLLDVNFNDRFNYPVIVFHEDFTDGLKEDIRKATRSNLQFEKIKFEIPDFLNREEIPEYIYVGEYEFSIGYRHMCRFMSSLIFQHPAIKGYDYLLRLDTDSFLLDKINYDIFRFMAEHNYIYGYIHIIKDEPDAVEGLWEVTKKYIEDNNIKPTFLHKFLQDGDWDRSYYYTNFEISRIDFWRSDEFMNYFSYLDKTGGIYKYRWGDHVIHLLAISTFVPENQVHRFSDIAYQHQGFVNNYSMDMEKINIIRNLKNKFTVSALKVSRNLKRKSKFYRKLLKIAKRE